MPLPVLTDWESTQTALHQALQPVRDARILTNDSLPNYLHLALHVTPDGVMSDSLAWGGELRLNFRQAAAVYQKDGKSVFTVPMEGHNQTTFFDAVFDEFKALGHDLSPRRDGVAETTPFKFDTKKSSDYADALWLIYSAFSQFKATLMGFQTPLVVWPHGFDLGSIWFIEGDNEHEDPHMSMGFSPGTPDIGQPYVYFYVWPTVEGLKDAIPGDFTWIDSWSAPGAYITYDQLRAVDDPQAFIRESFIAVRQAVLRLR